jgi:OmpA-OmpF porin, OOP family
MGIKKIGIITGLIAISVWCFAQTSTTNPLRNINSVYDEQSPVLSADGRTLFITLSHHPQNVGGLKDQGDIWMCTFDGMQWSSPVHGGVVLNDKGYNAVAGISNNGQQLFLLHQPGKDSEPSKTQGISVCSFQNNNWQKPVNISIPYFHTRSSTISGQVSKDRNYFVYSADTYGTLGVEDIYVTEKLGESWSEPKNLGASINTVFQEFSPSLNKTADTLFFSSNGRKGVGSFDVYASARLDDSWTNWSEPVNVSAINTEGRELFYTSTGKGSAFYTTTRNSDGYGDLKSLASIPLPKDSFLIDAKDTSSIEIPSLGGDKLLVTGKVIHAKTGAEVIATVTFYSKAEPLTTKSNATGYSIQIPAFSDYQVWVEMKDFISGYATLSKQSSLLKSIELNFTLQPIEVGTTVSLKNVLFKQSSTDLLSGSSEELNVVASFMRANPKVKIQLSGHTDNRGVQKDNVTLSQARVKKVKEYLVSKGVSKRRMSGRGYGGSKPIASNDSEESRKLNRRVEFTIIKN